MSGLRFAGYAAVFDRPDRAGDIIRKGAFRQSLTHRASHFPLLWEHEPSDLIGRIDHIAEDERGLRVIGRLSGRAGPAQRASALLSAGKVDGLSFGYRVLRSRSGPWRELLDIELVEVSLVGFPMQPHARVHAVEMPDGGNRPVPPTFKRGDADADARTTG